LPRAGRVIVVLTAALAVVGAGTAALATTSSAAVSPTVHPTSTQVRSLAPVTSPTTPSSAPATTERVVTTTAPEPIGIRQAPDSVPSAGWFHVVNATLPTGTSIVRYSNVARAEQTGTANHGAGALNLWFRAVGAPGSTITIRVEALDGYGQLLADVGTVAVATGDRMLPLPADSGEGRRMVVGSDQQQVWLVEDDGTVSDTFLMSGRRIPTASGADQPGVYRVYSKSKRLRYCEDGVCGTAQHMVRYQKTPVASVGTHSLPIEHGTPVQTVFELGWPLSHGCTRLEASKATEVYRWADFGTTVVVL
jgi:lipoprotein-anchoring transpeptidase ErfK/SrfK